MYFAQVRMASRLHRPRLRRPVGVGLRVGHGLGGCIADTGKWAFSQPWLRDWCCHAVASKARQASRMTDAHDVEIA
jgi:hypothetical protein